MSQPSHILFSETVYLHENPDVAAAVKAGVFKSGLAHWESYGKSEGRTASAYFDWEVYRDNNPDLVDAGLTTKSALTAHFNSYGVNEQRVCLSSKVFDYKIYAAQNPELAAAGITDRVALEAHFRQNGIYEGRPSMADFDPVAYINANADLKALLDAGGNINGFTKTSLAQAGWFHYLNWGLDEGRQKGGLEPTITLASQSTVSEGETLQVAVTQSVILSIDKVYTVSIVGDTNGGTVDAATAADFSIVSSTFTIKAGTTTANFSINPSRDQLTENLEGFRVTVFDEQLKNLATIKSVVLNAKPEIVPPTSHMTDPVEVGDNNADREYNAGDVITLQFSEPIKVTQNLLDVLITQFGTDKIVPNTAGTASKISITLPNSKTKAGDVVTFKKELVADQYDNFAVSDISFVIPTLGAYKKPSWVVDDPAPSASSDTTPPVATLFKVTGTTVGATSNEAGKLALYNGATEMMGLTANYTSPGGLTQTVTVATQLSSVNATLKVLDSAGNVATQTQSVILGTTAGDSGGGSLTGTAASDWMFGFDGNDTVNGNAGDDYLVGGQGADTIDGGADSDTISYGDVVNATSHGLTDVSGVAINLSGSAITAGTIATAMGSTVVLGGGAGVAGADLAAGTAGYLATSAANSTVGMVRDTVSNVENVVGSSLGDYINGGAANNVIRGGAGADYINLVSGTDDVVLDSPATVDRVFNFYFGTGGVNDQIVFDISGFTGANVLNRVQSTGAVTAITATPTTGTSGNIVLTTVDLTDGSTSTNLAASDILVVGGAAGAYSAATDTAAEIQALLRGATETISLTNATNFVGSFLIAYLAGDGTTPADLKLALVTSDGTGDTTAAASANVTVTDIAWIDGVSSVGELNGVAGGNAAASDFFFI